MLKKKLVGEFAKTAVDYGRVSYQYYESVEAVKREKSTLANLRRWARKSETRKVTHALESVRQEILVTQQRFLADSRYSKSLSRKVARVKRALETKTRELVTAK